LGLRLARQSQPTHRGGGHYSGSRAGFVKKDNGQVARGPSRETPCTRPFLWHDNGQVETTTDLATTQRPLSLGVVSSRTGRAGATFIPPFETPRLLPGSRPVTVANPNQSKAQRLFLVGYARRNENFVSRCSAGILLAVMRASCPHVLRRDASATAAETAALRDNPVTSVTDRESAKKGTRRDARFVVRCLVCRFQRQSYAEPGRRARRRQGCEGASIVPFDPAGHGSPDRGAGVAGRRAAHPAGRARSR